MSTPAQAAQTAVEYTISQDFAAGQIAEQDKNLQGFLDNGQVGPTGPGIHSGNHALQDYQMQLMLLEQQNKKRLLFVRQEEQKLEQQREASTLVSQQMGATRKRSRGDTQAEQACRNSSSASRTRKSQRKYAGGSVTNIERPEGNTPQESSATTTNRGAIGQDVSDMHRDTSRSARDRGHEVRITLR